MRERRDAVLLLGPTGVGKTPFGELLEAHGLRGRRCVHLDFGARLRAIAEGHRPASLTDADVSVVLDSLKAGALLENENFHIAVGIVDGFMEEAGVGHGDLVVLNGLPRHVGQAEDVDRILCVVEVVYLEATPEVVYERIRTNAGGDRAGRVDDTPEEVRRKLGLFCERTAPLLDHYTAKGVPLRVLSVDVRTDAAELLRNLTLDGPNNT